MKEMWGKVFVILAAAAVGIFLSDSNLFAVNAATNGFAADIYDIAVTKILKGPIGFVAGCACIALGAIAAVKSQIMTAIPAVLGGAALMKADAIVNSLGALF